MNDRLRELYREAHSIRHYDGDPAREGNPPTVYWQDEVSAERFVQLILQEAVAKIEGERFAYPDSNSDAEYDSAQSYYDCGYVDGMYRAETLIRELFGVEK